MKNQQPVSKTLETLLALLVFVVAALPVLLLLKSAIKFELYCYTVLLCAVLFLGSEGYLPRYNLAIRSHALTLLMISLSGLCERVPNFSFRSTDGVVVRCRTCSFFCPRLASYQRAIQNHCPSA